MTASRTASVRSWSFLGLKIVLTATVLFLLFRIVPPSEIVRAVREAEPLPVVAAVLLVVPQMSGRALRWHILLADAGERLSLPQLARVILVGYAFSMVTPAESGDYIARMRLQNAAPRAKVFGLTVVDKAVHFGTMAVVGLPSAVFLVTGNPVLAVGSFVLLLVIASTLFLLLRRLSTLHLGETPIRQRVQRALHAAGDVRRSAVARALAVSFLMDCVTALQEFSLLNALTTISFIDTWHGFWAGLSVRAVVPLFLGDLGIREATHVYFFGFVGVAAGAAMTASLLLFAINILFPSLVGLTLFLRPPAAKERAA